MKPSPKKLKETKEIYHTVLDHLISEGYATDPDSADNIIKGMSDEWFETIIEQMVVNVADVKGATPAAKFAASGKTGKDGKPMYTPGVGVGDDFKLKGV